MPRPTQGIPKKSRISGRQAQQCVGRKLETKRLRRFFSKLGRCQTLVDIYQTEEKYHQQVGLNRSIVLGQKLWNWWDGQKWCVDPQLLSQALQKLGAVKKSRPPIWGVISYSTELCMVNPPTDCYIWFIWRYLAVFPFNHESLIFGSGEVFERSSTMSPVRSRPLLHSCDYSHSKPNLDVSTWGVSTFATLVEFIGVWKHI